VLYRLSIDASSKANALALIAAAFNRGDQAMAAIAAVQMQFPNPPLSARTPEPPEEVKRRAAELSRSDLLKFWDPAKHPRADVPPNPGWFAPLDGASEAVSVTPAAMSGNPWDKSPLIGGGGGGGGGIPRLPAPEQPSAERPPVAPELPLGVPSSETQPILPFSEGLPPQLAPYVPGGKTSGILYSPEGPPVSLQSGYDGPSADMPAGSPGFDYRTTAHVEAQAAALMRQQGISDATLSINNPEICERCTRLLDRMLPIGATLNIILPDGTVKIFKGLSP
jgi:hypothetical protein